MHLIILNALKALIVNLAIKYGAELIVKHTLIKLEGLAKDTTNTIDDDLVAVLKNEQKSVVAALNGKQLGKASNE